MTLALYGKSRRRQGGLILAALLAILVATVGGLSVITSAFAHHATVTGKATCAATDGTFTVNWEVENSQADKWMHIDSVSVDAGTTPTISPDPVTKNVGNGGVGTGTSTVSAGTASVTLTVNVHWTTNQDDTGTRVPTTGS